jgi:hypothetical protein
MNTRANQSLIDACNDAVAAIPAHVRRADAQAVSILPRPAPRVGTPSTYSKRKSDYASSAAEYAAFMAAQGC